MSEEVEPVQSFEELFTQYFGRVYKFALTLTQDASQAEEITQNTFYKALKKIDSFQGRSDPGTWLCSIAKNEFFNRRARSRETAMDPSAMPRGGASPDAAEAVLREENRMRLMRCLHDLEEPYREVFMLRVFGELKYAQISALFGKTESWARVTFYRAKLEMQKRIREEDGEDEM